VDVEVEREALDWAETAEDVHRVLALLANWPALDRASRLVINRISEMNGNAYYILSPVAELLQEFWHDKDLNAKYFIWKHEQNPYLQEPMVYLMLVDEKVVGMHGFHGGVS